MAANETDKARYEIITQEAEDGTGDIIIPLPAPLLKSLGWSEETELAIGVNEDGTIFLKKAD
jgi:hypothetical protein|tara:strand:+ start:40 stop:225 length:186 start_codon:yes stop_codon:yes gene_type:complete